MRVPLVEAMAGKAVHVGPSGAGNVAKLINNMLVAAHMVTTGEAFRLAEAAGVKAEAVLQVVNAATGRSGISEIHFPKWIMSNRFDSGFATGLMRKDVGLGRRPCQGSRYRTSPQQRGRPALARGSHENRRYRGLHPHERLSAEACVLGRVADGPRPYLGRATGL